MRLGKDERLGVMGQSSKSGDELNDSQKRDSPFSEVELRCGAHYMGNYQGTSAKYTVQGGCRCFEIIEGDRADRLEKENEGLSAKLAEQAKRIAELEYQVRLYHDGIDPTDVAPDCAKVWRENDLVFRPGNYFGEGG
jgi:hypothetical protein